nr:MAG: hypothetical protein DIU62_11650 [Pseudomonadota bacterium]
MKHVLLLGAVAFGVGTLVCGSRSAGRRRHAEGLLEGGLEGTYPASDPVSTQDFDIPVNRRTDADEGAASTA